MIKTKRFLQFEDGFTLIELLVTISIIAILSGLSLFALAGSRESARDTTRKADLEKIRSGLELYKADCNGYPSSLPAVDAQLVGTVGNGCSPANTNVYMESTPGNPTGGSYTYTPSCVGSCVSYTLSTTLESDGSTYIVRNP